MYYFWNSSSLGLTRNYTIRQLISPESSLRKVFEAMYGLGAGIVLTSSRSIYQCRMLSLKISLAKSNFSWASTRVKDTHQFDLFCTSTIVVSSTFSVVRLSFDRNFTSTSLHRAQLYFDLFFSTKKKSRFAERSKYRGWSKRAEVTSLK